MKSENIVGKVFETNNYGKCTVIEYNSFKDVLVKFHNPEFLTKCRMNHLIAGNIKNLLAPLVYGKGYLGVGKYKPSNRIFYRAWNRVLERAYSKNWLIAHPCYAGTTVCDEWLNFQNFAEWCEGQKFFNAVDDKGKKYALDKDILVKGNKTYSPETCCFVPAELNSLLITANRVRDILPIGVSFYKKTRKYKASGCFYGKAHHIGYYDTPEEAFLAYKKAKESYIKEVAEKWKGRIEDKVYETLKEYSVDIDD